jgi:hypothetical protein
MARARGPEGRRAVGGDWSPGRRAARGRLLRGAASWGCFVVLLANGRRRAGGPGRRVGGPGRRAGQAARDPGGTAKCSEQATAEDSDRRGQRPPRTATAEDSDRREQVFRRGGRCLPALNRCSVTPAGDLRLERSFGRAAGEPRRGAVVPSRRQSRAGTTSPGPAPPVPGRRHRVRVGHHQVPPPNTWSAVGPTHPRRRAGVPPGESHSLPQGRPATAGTTCYRRDGLLPQRRPHGRTDAPRRVPGPRCQPSRARCRSRRA